MTTPERLPVFEKFIRDLRAAWAELPDTEARMKRAAQTTHSLKGRARLRSRLKSDKLSR